MIVLKSAPRPAVFLDRDGVLNIDKGYVYRKEDFSWVPGAKEILKLLNQLGFLIIVVTNQSGVARGLYKETDVIELHEWMNQDLKKDQAWIDGFYYCPHHPEAAIEFYRCQCDCRKPAPGLIFKAMNEWAVNSFDSFLVGDRPSDIQAADRAGIKSFLYNPEKDNLYDFMIKILKERERL